MNGFTVIAACIGCLLALYLWTATKQRWVPDANRGHSSRRLSMDC